MIDPPDLEALEEVQRRVLWLSTLIVHHANRVRPSRGGLKVGGHQASSASAVSILTSLFFDFMRAGDRVSVKPHASPVLHAIHYLLGNLERRYLTSLREFHGLQAYPSRTKDPFPVDFSTGSVGLGSVAPNFAALVDRYLQARFEGAAGARFISVLGDAELDEGSVWEAVAEPALGHLDNLIWVIDLNRQSLDRVVPGIRVHQLEEMFRANGWAVLEAKYGRRLEAAFGRPGGEALRDVIDRMPNEQYQLLLRSEPAAIRARIGGDLLNQVPDEEVGELIADLGGHDLTVLRRSLEAADAADRPAVIFAYTIKGWRLPIAGDPLNHSALLSAAQVDAVRAALDVPAGDPWAGLAAETPAGALCAERRRLLTPAPRPPHPALEIPADLGREYPTASTQRIFGQVLTGLLRAAPEAAGRVVTVSPDVATSTNLGGWINRVGVWEPSEAEDIFASLGPRLIDWRRRPGGQHIELGISETNLLMLLGQLGLAGELADQPLLPVGTLYDPFVARALDAFVYGLYGGGRFILVGTPSGVTLAPEGGAHQSVITPSIGLSMPRLTYYEPCFGLELEWILLEALRALHRERDPESSYLRLSTAPIDQSLLEVGDREDLRRRVLSGAYRLIDRTGEPGCRPGHNLLEIWACGVMVPEAVGASADLRQDGVYASVVNCVSPSLIYRRWQEGIHQGLDRLRPAAPADSPAAPLVTVLDGHPSALAWVGAMLGRRTVPLGVTRFGESGTPADLYQACRIDRDSICAAAYLALAG